MSLQSRGKINHHSIEALESLKTILSRQAVQPIHGDEVIAAYSQALKDLLDTSDEAREIFLLLFGERHGDIDPWIENNLAFRAVHRWLLHPPEGIANNYPAGSEYTNPQTFTALLPQVLGIKGYNNDYRFWADMLWRKVQSNVDRRYGIINLLQLLPDISDLFENGISVCDIGCSQNQGLKHLGLKLPFGTIALDSQSSVGENEFNSARNIINDIVNRNIELVDSVGNDVFHMDDVENKEWVTACSLLPKELKVPGKRDEFTFLLASDVDNVGFIKANFALRESVDRYFNNQQFDLVTFFTVLYQVTDEERRAMFDNAMQIGTRYILIVDAAKKVENCKSDHPMDSLHFDTEYFTEEYGYRTFLFDIQNPDKGFVELWRMKSGRCESILLLEEHELAISGLYKNLRS